MRTWVIPKKKKKLKTSVLLVVRGRSQLINLVKMSPCLRNVWTPPKLTKDSHVINARKISSILT